MSNGSRGAVAERRAAQELRAAGYTVTRSGASKGAYDLIAVGPRDILLLSIKLTKQDRPSRVAPRTAVESLRDAPAPRVPEVRKELWTWVDRVGWRIKQVDW